MGIARHASGRWRWRGPAVTPALSGIDLAMYGKHHADCIAACSLRASITKSASSGDARRNAS